MYQRALFSSFALLAIAGYAIYRLHIQIHPEDTPAYHKLIQESTELRTRHALEEQPAHQDRSGVQKDIWTQNETRHLQIHSQQSQLTLSQKRDTVDALEELKQIRCLLDGDTLTADEGIYTYPAHQFIAQNHCKLTQNGNILEGTRVHFDFIQETVTYDNPQGFLIQGPLHFTAHSLIWHKKEGKLHLTQHVTITQPDQFTLEADRGLLTLTQFDPQLLTLEGHVHLHSNQIQGKDSYALADTLTYHPLDKTILLSAAKKVLFWQEGLSLSASQVRIHHDQTVEGLGDVHFAFDLEEQNFIDQLFKQYL
jgi:lipopolysaccharide export system protein LptA